MKRGAIWQPIVIALAVAALSCGDDGGSSGETTSATNDEGESTSGSSGGEESTGAGMRPGEGENYPSCAGPWECSEEPTCIEFEGGPCEGGLNFALGFCTRGCMLTEECPASPGGDAPVTCGSLPGLGTENLCFLDCTRGETCPDGMTCEEAAVSLSTCIWAECG